MKFYEVILLVSQDTSVSDIHKIVEHYVDIVTKFSGFLVKKEYWGIRSIFHGIRGIKKANFLFLKIKSSVSLLDRIKEDYKYNESILRGFVIKAKKDDEYVSSMVQELTN